MAEMTMVEGIARAICKAAGDDADEIIHFSLYSAPRWKGAVHLACAAIEAMREPTSDVATAHRVGFLRLWTDPWDCLGPEQEDALGLDVGGSDMWEEAQNRIADYMRVAWWDAVDVMLGKPVRSRPDTHTALAEQP